MLSFTTFGTKIYISFSFTVCITLLAILDKSGLLFVSFIAVFFHELGHYIALKLCGIKAVDISFILASVKLNIHQQITDKTTVIIAFCGPAFNLLLSGFILTDNYYIKYFGVANFILFMFNMLPVSNLDGGDILKYIVCTIFKKNGNKIFCVISKITICLFIAPIGVFFMLKFKNPTILLVGIYIFIMSYRKV